MFLNVIACYYTYGYAVYILRCTLESIEDAKAFMKEHNTVGTVPNTRRSKT
jgi:DNA-binding Lrp family transcriptional regulator